MNKELAGKTVAACELQNCTNYQRLGFVNTYLSDFDKLIGQKVASVVSRGNTIKMQLQGGMNLLLAPEYGGIIRIHPNPKGTPKKYTLKLCFTDQTALTVTLTGMGIIHALTDTELSGSYVYRRDFSGTASPTEPTFTPEQFSRSLEGKNVNLKTALVGKDAVIVGLGNAAFMDILYRAHLHPKRKATELTPLEKKAALRIHPANGHRTHTARRQIPVHGPLRQTRPIPPAHGTQQKRLSLHRMPLRNSKNQLRRRASLPVPSLPEVAAFTQSLNLNCSIRKH